MGRKRKSMNQVKSMPDDQKVNPLFEKYYREQGIVSDDEWDTFIDHLKADLIATFRVTGFREQSGALLRLIQSQFVDRLRGEKGDSGEVPRPTPLSWYPGEMAWSLNATRQSIRRSSELKKLHTFLVSETETGFISRQEAVSMIPPLLLDVRSHHAVLDLCAAPGSKTAQLVELLHSDGRLDVSTTNSIPTGVVVANDRDNDRCYMMIHQVKRLQSPCVVVMRQDATIFPRLRLGPQAEGEPETDMLFDRVLADVPCSGDGTLRKNPDLWHRWNPGLGVSEHFVQARIVKRGLELLKVGGRLVYSTCSLNPVEDEAVICSVLKQSGDSVRLVDVSGQLPGLKTEPGLKKWKVMTKEGEWVATPDEVPAKHRRSLRPCLFPPEDDASLPPLERCRRILPHRQNTGGFFIAVLEKVDNLPWMNVKRQNHETRESGMEDDKNKEDNETPKESAEGTNEREGSPQPPSPSSSDKAPPAKKSRRAKMIYKEDPFLYMDRGDPEWAKVQAFYGVDAGAWPTEQLLFRCAEGKRRNFYFTNALLRRIVKGNGNREGVNFINLGVKMFAICEDNGFGGYRLLQEGLDLYEPLVTLRRISVRTRRDLMVLLRYEIPLMYRFSDEVRKQFDELVIGPVVIDYERQGETVNEVMEEELQIGDANLPSIRLTFTGWRGKVSLRLYVNKHERAHLMRLCGIIDPPPTLEDHGLAKNVGQVTANEEPSAGSVKEVPSAGNVKEAVEGSENGQ